MQQEYQDQNDEPYYPGDPYAPPNPGNPPPIQWQYGEGATPDPGAPKSVPIGPGQGTGQKPATGYNLDQLKAALLGLGGRASADSLKAFIAAHPEFATGVTIGGSKNNKLYDPTGKFLADVIQGTSGSNPMWAWDDSIGGSSDAGAGGAAPIDQSYLNPFTTTFQDFYQQLYGTPYSGDTPTFQGPGDFVAPSAADAVADPGYQFRLGQGEAALENSAAAKGTLNSGGTLSDLINYGQKAASQEYSDVWNRNYGTWSANWQHALDAFNTDQARRSTMFNNADNLYKEAKDTWYQNQTNPFSKLMQQEQLGLYATT